MAPKVERITEIPPTLIGAAPHWDEATQSLYFVDVYGKTIHKYVPSTGYHAMAIYEQEVVLVIPVKNTQDRFIIASNTDISMITWDGKEAVPSKIEKIAENRRKKTTCTRLNDGKCDVTGRLWLGSTGIKKDETDLKGTASLFSLNNGQLKTHVTQVTVSNGLTWNIQLKKFYYIDSMVGTIDSFDYDELNGTIANRTPIFTLKKHNIPGIADGMTIDVDGNLWIAILGGYRIIKIDPRRPETLLMTIYIPAKQVISVAWGGPDLDTLYVTTGYHSWTREDLLPHIHPGSTYRITDLGTKGLPANSFVL